MYERRWSRHRNRAGEGRHAGGACGLAEGGRVPSDDRCRIAAARGLQAGEANGDRVGQRDVRGAFDAPKIEAAILTGDIAGKSFGCIGLSRNHFDRAACRVAAVQRALRTCENFDAVDVEEVEVGAGTSRDVLVVEIDANRGIQRNQGIVLDLAAQRIGLLRGVTDTRLDVQTRRFARHGFDRRHVALDQFL